MWYFVCLFVFGFFLFCFVLFCFFFQKTKFRDIILKNCLSVSVCKTKQIRLIKKIFSLKKGSDLAKASAARFFPIFPWVPPRVIFSPEQLEIFLYLSYALLDNYEADENRPEKTNATELLEEDALIDAMVVSGGPMDIAFQYLKEQGSISFNVNTTFDFLYPISYP